jgi:hypothetical protein
MAITRAPRQATTLDAHDSRDKWVPYATMSRQLPLKLSETPRRLVRSTVAIHIFASARALVMKLKVVLHPGHVLRVVRLQAVSHRLVADVPHSPRPWSWRGVYQASYPTACSSLCKLQSIARIFSPSDKRCFRPPSVARHLSLSSRPLSYLATKTLFFSGNNETTPLVHDIVPGQPFHVSPAARPSSTVALCLLPPQRHLSVRA